MAEYLFTYHGGGMPETEAEQQAAMQAWGDWFQGMGAAVKDPGNPVGQSSTVHPGGEVEDNGGANPVSGYSVVEAASQDAAIELAKGCPILNHDGTVEVTEIIELEM